MGGTSCSARKGRCGAKRQTDCKVSDGSCHFELVWVELNGECDTGNYTTLAADDVSHDKKK